MYVFRLSYLTKSLPPEVNVLKRLRMPAQAP
jgi:hypothetical protein